MSFNLQGLRPDSPVGQELNYSSWTWRPILDVVRSSIGESETATIDPHATTHGWDFNDGGGLRTGNECVALAESIQIWMLTDENRDVRLFELLLEHADGQPTRDPETGRPMHSATRCDVLAFVGFLYHCGGFEIW